MFKHIEPFAGDPILSLNEVFQADPRQDKINLTIGIYFDEEGKIPVLAAVREAERRLAEHVGPKPYLPMEGMADFRSASQALLFGADHPLLKAGRVATIQTVGSSGGLRVAADFFARWLPKATVYVSEPTWENHKAVCQAAHVPVASYPYYDAATGGVRFDAMCAALEAAPAGSVILLHGCCHNPTGADLTRAQWDTLIALCKARGLLPFIDTAYQGFGDGLVEDAYAVRALAAADMPFLVTNSYSKNLSVYGERSGALSVVCPDADQAERVLGQLKAAVRSNYSNPPMHGAQLVTMVLTTPDLRLQWESELAAMRSRIRALRERLHAALVALKPGMNFGYLLSQRGMFSYTGLAPEQVERLKSDWGVYVLRSGRLCVAGLNDRNVDRVAQAIAAVV